MIAQTDTTKWTILRTFRLLFALYFWEIITLNTLTPSIPDSYWNDELYDKENLQPRHDDYPLNDDKDDPKIKNNRISRALFEHFELLKPRRTSKARRGPGYKQPLRRYCLSLHSLVTKEGEPAYIPLSTNLCPKFKRWMLYFPMEFEKLTLDGPIDTGAIPGEDLEKRRLLARQFIIKEVPVPIF